MAFNKPYQLQWESLGIPLVKGLQTRTRARLVEAQGFAVAENVEYPVTGGAQKRRGHTATRITVNPGGASSTLSAVTPSIKAFDAKTVDSAWLPGFGPRRIAGAKPAEAVHVLGAVTTARGAFAWTGDQFVGGKHVTTPKLLPTCRENGVSYVSEQSQVSLARYSEEAWAETIDTTVSVYREKALASRVSLDLQRVIVAQCDGAYVVVGVDGLTLVCHKLTFGGVLGPAVTLATGLTSINDVAVKVVGSTVYIVVGGGFHTGGAANTYTFNYTSSGLTYHTSILLEVPIRSVAVDVLNGSVLVGLTTASGFNTALFSLWYAATVATVPSVVGTTHALTPGGDWTTFETYHKCAAAFRRELNADGSTQIDGWASCAADVLEPIGVNHWEFQRTLPTMLYMSATIGGAATVRRTPGLEVVSNASTPGYGGCVLTLWHGVAGARLGDNASATFVEAYPSTQPTFLFVDWNNEAIGVFNALYAASGKYRFDDAGLLTDIMFVGVKNPHTPFQDGTLKYTTYTVPNTALMDEFVLNRLTIDYVPPLSWVEHEGVAYIAGCLLWAFDGEKLISATPLVAPETEVALVLSPGTDVRGFRVELGYEYAFGKQARSFTVPYNTFDAPAGGIDLRIYYPFDLFGGVSTSTAYTVRIYATEPNGANYHYTQVTAEAADFDVTVEGSLLKTVVAINAADFLSLQRITPSGNTDYLQPYPAPASSYVAVAKGRVWVAGGQLPTGMQASRLTVTGEALSFNALNTVELNERPLAITQVGDTLYALSATTTYGIPGDGPDNVGQGGEWGLPRVVAHVGASQVQRPVVTPRAAFFLGTGGIYAVSGGSVQPVPDADVFIYEGSVQRTLADTLSVRDQDQARWYFVDGTVLVLDVREMRFSTWTGLKAYGVCYTDRAILANGAKLYRQATGAEVVWRDDGVPIVMRLVTANLTPAGLADFHRVRRVAWLGEFRGPHTVRLRVFQNEKATHSQEALLDWSVQPGVVASAWGGGWWGFGAWGGATAGDVWRWSVGLATQKCSVVKFELSDLGADSASFAPVCLGLEVGRRGGIDRVRNNF